MSTASSFAICIPTYKRTDLLQLLVTDLMQQSIDPVALIVVDGFPSSGNVIQMLQTIEGPPGWQIVCVPSNHSNLAYQRYLGWQTAAQLEVDVLIYFDDDQRIYQADVLEWLVRPFNDEQADVVGVGCFSHAPETNHDQDIDYFQSKEKLHWLTRLFGSHQMQNLKPGQLTPTGHRVGLVDNGQDYIGTEWLYGRIMAYRMSAMSDKTFSNDLFALYEHRIGRAEDTFLSRRVGAHGKLLYTFRAVVEHPNADTPKAYASGAYKFAYTATYSRRFLNDHYRVYGAPTLVDRWALIKSYVGNMVLIWIRTLSTPSKTHLAQARGITLGALHGLTRPPTAKRLTPDIDWRADAQQALIQSVNIN